MAKVDLRSWKLSGMVNAESGKGRKTIKKSYWTKGKIKSRI